MYSYPGKKLVFMGGEFGQWQEWNHDRSLDWHLLQFPMHAGLRRLVQHLNFLYRNEPALWQLDDSYEGFEWIDFHDAESSIVAYFRKAHDGPTLIFVVNATPVPRHSYRLGAVGEGWYEEILNTDAETYGGSNVGNYGGVHAGAIPLQGERHSICSHPPPARCVPFYKHSYLTSYEC